MQAPSAEQLLQAGGEFHYGRPSRDCVYLAVVDRRVLQQVFGGANLSCTAKLCLRLSDAELLSVDGVALNDDHD
jgi:hypothetical protein